MSTYSFVSKLRKGMNLYRSMAALPILCGILIVLQLVLPSAASAFASAPPNSFSLGTNQALDRAGVSVVRLVANYAPTVGTLTPPQCTGLGVLIKSWKANGDADENNWVLTDGSLVNPSAAICDPGQPNQQLASIQVLANNTYTANMLAQPLLGTFTITATNAVHCQSTPCSNGAALFAFHTDMTDTLPFLDLATTDLVQVNALELKNTSTPAIVPASLQGNQAQQFLNLSPQSLQAIPVESGLPFVNDQGQLVSMHIAGNPSFDATAISDFESMIPELKAIQPAQLPHINDVNDAWNKGITDYYAGRASLAQTDFQQAHTLNPQFQAASTFWTVLQNKVSATQVNGNGHAGKTSTPVASGRSTNALGMPNSQVIWVMIAGVILLVFLLALLSLVLVRRQTQRRHDAEILHRADRKAEVDAARIAEQEKAERLQEQQAHQNQQARQQQASVGANNTNNIGVLPIADLRCSNCGQPVKADDNFCSNCRFVLSPTESGLHRRASKPPLSSPPLAPLSSVSASPPGPMPSLSSPPPGVVSSASIYEQPTKEMSPSRVGNGQMEAEKTLPFSVEHLSGRNLSLAVGTRSDRGIKRQHKPNEDSLFAAQGERTNDSQVQQFGLFVVADGMGGHANGQDASRLAIQTIVDRLLPRLSSNEHFSDDALVHLLEEGVQEANQAVHQRNMEDRADMGTTMTAALVMGTMAYVANVGDSRTYLYREPGGLRKITNDHSVVASLVEAGIIKPDDIYTHPKRNQIYRSLGEKPVIDVDSFTVSLQPGDKLLLCSDGLWDMVRDPTIEQVLSTVPDPSQMGNALIKAALEGGGDDNVSVIVVQITEVTQHTGMTGIQLLARPDAPQYPPI